MMAAVGILQISGHLGRIVGEHGIGGSEYSVAPLVQLLALMAAEVVG